MASMRDIKRRKSSIQSTQQITKAMKLVSTVKLQKTRQQAEQGKEYFHQMYDSVQGLLARTEDLEHPYLQKKNSRQAKLQEAVGQKKGVVIISSNRGLAGGYNSNVARKLMEQKFLPENTWLYTVGQKAREYLKGNGYVVRKDFSEAIEKPVYEESIKIRKELLEAFMDGQVSELYLVYTEFANTVLQIPKVLKLLPVEKAAENTSEAFMNYEPDLETVLEYLIPIYIESVIYGAMVEAVASENSARMQAMDSATGNAEEMIRDLSLKYNRARQNSITQELTEIIAGADAI